MPDVIKIVFRTPEDVKAFIGVLGNLYRKTGMQLSFWYKNTGDCMDFEEWFKNSRFSRPDGVKDYPFCVVLDDKGCGYYEAWQFDDKDKNLTDVPSAIAKMKEYALWAERGYTDDCKIVDEH